MKKFLKKTEVGQALVEFAIVLPLLLSILCGILDFGWIYLNEYETNHATYEAARYAAMHMDDTGMTEEIMENNIYAMVENNLSHKADGLTVEITGLTTSTFPSVTVINPIHTLTFVGGAIFGPTFDITVTNTFSK